MKIILPLVVLCIVLFSCNDEPIGGIMVEVDIDLSVVKQSTMTDLLNQAEKEHYDYNKILLEFSSFPNQRTGIEAIQASKPQLFEKNGKFYLKVYPVTREALSNEHILTIYWTDTEKDVITFVIKKEGNITYTEKVLVNGVLKWDKSKGNREIALLK